MSGVVAASKGSGRCCGAPRGECARTQKALMGARSRCRPTLNRLRTTSWTARNRAGLCRRFETPHVALASARQLVGGFGPVVGVAGRVVDHGRHDHAVRGTVAPEAIGDEAARDPAAPLEQLAKEPRGGVAIPARLEQDVDDLAVLVDRQPEVLTLATNRHEELVEMPRVADRPGPMSEPPGVREAEDLAPMPNGFVRDSDTAVRQ